MASSSPRSGCAIGIVGLVVFTLATIWAVYTGYTQNKAISQFTQPAPGDLQVTYRDPNTVFEVRSRVRAFGKSLQDGQPATLSLSAADLNDLIGHERVVTDKDMHKIVSFASIGETLKGRIAFPMNGIPLIGKPRYLNATVDFTAQIEEEQLMLKIVDLKPDTGGEVPEGFLNFISGNVNLVATIRDEPSLKPIFKRIQSVDLKDERLVINAN